MRIKRKGEAEVAIQAALVDLVKQHRRHARQFGIGLNPVAENSFGQNENARRTRLPLFKPGRIADPLANRLACQFSHALRRRPRGEAARRKQQDLAGAPRLGEQRGRNRSRFTSAGRRDEHGV